MCSDEIVKEVESLYIPQMIKFGLRNSLHLAS